MQEIDYSDVNDHEELMKPVEQVMAGLQAIVDEARGHTKKILELEDELKKAKALLKGITQDTLPRALREAGFGDVGFPCTDGTVVMVKDKMDQAVKVENREEAWNWLERNRLGDILKREVTIAFAVGDGEKAKALKSELETKYMRSVESRRWVEPATLKSVLAKLIKKQGKDPNAPVVPLDLFGVREYSEAVFQAPKEKK